MGPVCCEIVRSLLQTLRVHIYTLALTRLLVDHDYNIYCLKLIPWRHVRLIPVINSSPSLYSIHVITHSRMLSAFTPGTILPPDDDVLPTANASSERFEENLLPNGTLLPNSAHMSVSSLYQFLVLTAAFRHWPSAPPHVATASRPFPSSCRPCNYRATASARPRAYKPPSFFLARPRQSPPHAISVAGELAFSLVPVTNP
jgi:hypothetical protein